MNLPNAVPEMTVSSGRPSGCGGGLDVLEGAVEIVPYPSQRPKRLGFDEVLEWVLGAMLGVGDREAGVDCEGVAWSSKPLGNTTLYNL